MGVEEETVGQQAWRSGAATADGWGAHKIRESRKPATMAMEIRVPGIIRYSSAQQMQN